VEGDSSSGCEVEYEVLLMVKGRCGAERVRRMNGRGLESRRRDFMHAKNKPLSLQCVCKQAANRKRNNRTVQ
jgi:hypothetical protein